MSGLFSGKRSYAENLFWSVLCFVAALTIFIAALSDHWVPGAVFDVFVAILGVKLGFGYLGDARRGRDRP